MFLPLGLFAVAALLGLLMAVRVLAGSPPPWAMSLLHAALGASGIVTLYLAIAGVPVGGPAWIALGLFVIAALGGFFLASFHLRGKAHPKGVVVIHALVAVSAFALLAGAAFNLI